jgi:hypothetical protein
VYLTESGHAPYGKLESLAILRTNVDGAGIVQAVGPLKALASADASNGASARRFLVVTMPGNPSQLVLRQVETSSAKKPTS